MNSFNIFSNSRLSQSQFDPNVLGNSFNPLWNFGFSSSAQSDSTWSSSFMRWLCSTNHKDIGTLYICFSMFSVL